MKNFIIVASLSIAIILTSLVEPLENVFINFGFLYSKFNIPLLILVIVLIFKNELRNLINRASKITYGDKSLELNSLTQKLGNTSAKYSNTELKEPPAVGGGGGSDNNKNQKTSVFQILYNQNMLENHLNSGGKVATVQKLYKTYEKSLRLHYKLNFTDVNFMREKILENGNKEEIELFNEIILFYSGVTYLDSSGGNAEKLISNKDVLNYRRIIAVAISEFYYYSIFNHKPNSTKLDS